jgi:hypothetical protein
MSILIDFMDRTYIYEGITMRRKGYRRITTVQTFWWMMAVVVSPIPVKD